MPLLSKLKTQTADSHAGLEQTMDVFAGVQSLAAYCELLQRFFTLYEPLEGGLAAATDWRAAGWEFDAKRRTPLLREDLAALGVPSAQIAAWPRCRDLPALPDFGACVGCLYVLEGSTLGGQMISRHFREKLAVVPEHGGRFFHGYGEATGAQWRAFGQWAESCAERGGAAFEASAVASARATFETFAKWMPR